MLEAFFKFPLSPEIMLATIACVVLLADLYLPETRKIWVYWLSQFALAVTALSVFHFWGEIGMFASGHFIADNLAVVLKIGVLLVSFVLFAYVEPYLARYNIPAGEFYILALFSILGMCVLISAGSLLTLYLGLELLSLPLYAMVAMMRQAEDSSEAAIKYFVMGALASGMLLFGMSLVYGATGSLTLDGLPINFVQSPTNMLLVLGLVFMIIGIAFKFGAVPFHMWIPDVYTGTRNPIVLMIATAPKLAAFGMLTRILWDLFGGMSVDWQPYLFIMAVLSLILGNIVAIAQTNVKRMLGYSAIAHVGFIFLAVYVNDFAAAMFYVLTYSIMALAAFGVLTALSYTGKEVENISDLRGLDKQHRWAAFLLMLVMFSLAGIPPTVGFYAKLTVLGGLVGHGAYGLAGLALLTSVVAAYYYLRIVWVMYFEEPEHKQDYAIPQGTVALLSINALATWVLGIFPGALMALCLALFM